MKQSKRRARLLILGKLRRMSSLEDKLGDALKKMVRLSTPNDFLPPYAYVKKDVMAYTLVIDNSERSPAGAGRDFGQRTIDTLSEIFMTHNIPVAFDAYGMKATIEDNVADVFLTVSKKYCDLCEKGEEPSLPPLGDHPLPSLN